MKKEYLIVDDLVSRSPTCLGCNKLIRRGERYRVNLRCETYGIQYKSTAYADGISPYVQFISKERINPEKHVLTNKRRLRNGFEGYVCNEQCLEYYKLLKC